MLGEDSGLELAALGGRPGVETARWAGGRHVERALEALAGEADRSARYVCELVALSPDGVEARGTGTLEGQIALEPRGDEGFGFDPVFVPDGEERTVAELGDAWKAEHSHRARAAQALLRSLPHCPNEPPPRPTWRARLTAALGDRLPPGNRQISGASPREPPVELGAQHDDVRHEVEPDEEDDRAAERLEAGRALDEVEVEGQHLEGQREHDRGRERARQDVPRRVRDVRQQEVRDEEEGERRER